MTHPVIDLSTFPQNYLNKGSSVFFTMSVLQYIMIFSCCNVNGL